MKILSLTITAEFKVPEDWKISEHADGIDVLKIGDVCCDFDWECFTAKPAKNGVEWSFDPDITDKLLSFIQEAEVKIDIAKPEKN